MRRSRTTPRDNAAALCTPRDPIPPGDETARLHRWGYAHYRELFNARQLLGLEKSCSLIAAVESAPVREALATNLSDLLRYQNMLCRYDTMALKSLDVFSVHGFPVGLIQCESNILGIVHPAKRQLVGSGGWMNMIEKFTRAKRYCERPFEIRHERGRKIEVAVGGEWIGERRNGSPPTETRRVRLTCADAASVDLGKRTFDAVFTDPPYFGNVQYAELMDFCFVWLRRLVGNEHPQFAVETTRHAAELTGNANMGRDLAHFTEGISRSFRKAAAALKEGDPWRSPIITISSPLIFRSLSQSWTRASHAPRHCRAPPRWAVPFTSTAQVPQLSIRCSFADPRDEFLGTGSRAMPPTSRGLCVRMSRCSSRVD